MTHIVQIHAALKVRKPTVFRQCLAKRAELAKMMTTVTTGIAKILAAGCENFAHRITHLSAQEKHPVERVCLFYDVQPYVIAAGHCPRHQQHIAQTAWSQATLFFSSPLATLCPATPAIARE
jgi:hypothetical protein